MNNSENKKKKLIGSSITVASISILIIIFLATGIWKNFDPKPEEIRAAVIITPREAGLSSANDQDGPAAWNESRTAKIPLEDNETIITVFTRENETYYTEEQFIVFTRISDTAREVFLTYIGFDEQSRRYTRMWDVPAAAARPETISLFSQDLIGDRNNCIIITGMNNQNEHTITIFRKIFPAVNQAYRKIAEIQIDGSIKILETPRTNAYQQGITNGQSFNIAAYGHDNTSNNILDQIETIYSFNPENGQYEQTGISRIPGSQIEQRQLREILSGAPGVFENFINDLWYYVSPQGTVDSKQYLYFNSSSREIIFYGDETQQVFHWQNSTPTRYGLYVRSQNISISTLLRFIDIELESLESIRLRVIEDVQLKITANTTWDGSYRKAGIAMFYQTVPSIKPAKDAFYDSTWGRLQFKKTGEYIITSGSTTRRGHYVFYAVDGQELLELRPTDGYENKNRLVYKAEDAPNSSTLLSPVRIGTAGIQDLFETPVILTPVNND
ncbi:MAG: pallilysin-related adhesin [Treponema sp.]|nr:pallilysin-related adhesin [Treponema sp.]MCL2272682.1 pallilysin-related adhesin [Treponema sp.]